MNTKKYTYKQIENLLLKIIKDIKKDKIDLIIAISRGGLIPAAYLAYALDVKNVIAISVSSYKNKKQTKLKMINAPNKKDLLNKNILVIDDICDSGNTLVFIEDYLKKNKAKNIKTATIFLNKKKSKYVPDYYGEETTIWIVFPWDKFEKN